MAAPNPTSGLAAPIPDDDNANDALPLPLSASVMLSALPKDAKAALDQIDLGDRRKGKSSHSLLLAGSRPLSRESG
jgi:hypothetical protein